MPADWRDRLEATGLAVPRGCANCIDGHKGRVGVFELLPCTPEIAALIRKGTADGAELRRAAAGAGMLEMREDALEKLASGATDLAEVAGALSI